MKTLVVRLMLCLAAMMPLASWAQRVGEWRSFPAYHNATQCELFAGEVFVVSDGSLYSYLPSGDGSVTTYSKHQPLTGTGILRILRITATNELAIIYSDGNIDILDSDCESVFNISELKQKSLSSKQINDAWTDGSNVYISGGFGITVVNVAKREFAATYMIDGGVVSTVVHNGAIYAATPTRTLVGRLTDNLLDKSAWGSMPIVCNRLETSGGALMAHATDGTMLRINDDGTTTSLGYGTLLRAADNGFVVGDGTYVGLMRNDFNSYPRYDIDASKFRDVAVEGSTLWVAAADDGLMGFSFNKKDRSIVKKVSSVIPDSPLHNYANYMTVTGGKLLVSGGGISHDRFERPGTLMEYANGSWRNFSVSTEQSGVVFSDITNATEDPLTPGHYWAASAGEGLYEFTDYKFSKLHTFRNSDGVNSIYEGTAGTEDHFMRLNGVRYDRHHNLWVLNGYMEEPVRILLADGKWMKLPINEMKGSSTPERIMFDSRGWAWIVNHHVPASAICYNYGSDVSDTSDDDYLCFSSNIVNQDGISYSPYYFTAIAEDRDGAIWVGTSVGLFCIANPERAMANRSTVMSQVKVPRNDGTNTADYLLSGAYINDIAIDGANRKWVATTSGVYCVSADGLETVNHFTSLNSPLPDDNVSSIAIDEARGEVFMGSEHGIVSYMTDAVTPAAKLVEDDVYASPNPVTPDYDGLITVRGLIEGSYVKITTTSGTLVAEGRSNGGLFTWNGCTADGRRVVSGVYYVLVSNEDVSEHVASRIVVVR